MTNSSNNSEENAQAESKQVARPETSTAKTPTIQKRKKNALTHGVYAEDFLLDWESEDDLIMLRDDLWAELQPEGRFEEETALGLVNLLWQKRRVMRTAQLGFRRDPFAIEAGRSKSKSMDDLVRLVTSAAGEETKLSDGAKESLEALKKASEKIMEINMVCVRGHDRDGPPKEAFEAAQKAKTGVELVEQLFDQQVFPRMIALELASKSGGASVYEKAYSHEHLEKTSRIESVLDSRIDKQMARFANLKEYKRIRKETSKPVLEAVPIAPA
jgi:hypothetical protein